MADFDLQGMYDWAVRWCNKPHVEYHQGVSYRNMCEIDGITYFDCSSFVFFAIWLGGGYDVAQLGFPNDLDGYRNNPGVDGHNAWWTGSMPKCLSLIGFKRYNPVEVLWEPGDILHWHNSRDGKGHTEICYAKPRITMGAHNRSSRTSDDMVSINTWNSASDSYDNLFRYTGEVQVTPYDPPGDNSYSDAGYNEKRKKFWIYMKPYWKI